jgi:hypothetical protein
VGTIVGLLDRGSAVQVALFSYIMVVSVALIQKHKFTDRDTSIQFENAHIMKMV